MTSSFQDMLYLFKCTSRGDAAELKRSMDFKHIYDIAVEQQVFPIIFPEIENAYNNGYFEIEKKDFENKKNNIMSAIINGIQKQELMKKVLKKMEEADVHCILLKGALLADLYFRPENRLSGDIDLYVSPDKEKEAIDILKECGFSVEKRLDTEHHSDCTHKVIKSLELHVSLYEDYCTDIWFDSISYKIDDFEKYTTKQGYTYNTFLIDDQLIFNVLHLIKHFLSSGLGIRQIMDVILFIEQNYEKIDYENYSSIMKKLKFDYFMDCCMKIGVDYLGADPKKLLWINNYKIKDEDCIKILEDIEEAGLFGHNDEHRRTFTNAYTEALYKSKFEDCGEEYKKKRQRSVLLSVVFLDYERMKLNYSYLKHGRWLLPVAWIHRGIKFIFKKKDVKKLENTDMQEKHLELMRDMKIL